MRKLQLNVEDLAVTSFETQAEAAARKGTVQAHGYVPVPETQYQTCAQTYCGEYSCGCVDLSARTLCGIPLTAYNCTNGCGID